MFLPHPRVKVSFVGSLCDREVACSASNRQGSNFESCVWRTVSSHHPQEVLLAQFSLYVHKGGLKPDSFHFYRDPQFQAGENYLGLHNYPLFSTIWIYIPMSQFNAFSFLLQMFLFEEPMQNIKTALNGYMISASTLKALKYFYANHGAKGFFRFEIIVNVLVGSFRFIWIPILWVYGHYKYFNPFSAETVYRRQILPYKDDPRARRVKGELMVYWGPL